MVVGDDVAVSGEDEPGAGGGGLHRLPEDVGAAAAGDVDGHHAVDVGGVDLRVAHLRLAVHGLQGDLVHRPVADLDGGLAGAVSDPPGDPAAHGAAQQGAAQGQGRDLQSGMLLFHRLHLLHGLLRPVVDGISGRGGPGRLSGRRLAAVLPVGVVVQILFVVIHN